MRFLTVVAVFIGGAIAVMGWAPTGIWPVSLAGFGMLYWLLQREAGVASSAAIGFLFGLGLHMAGHGWVYTAMHTKTGLGIIPAALGSLIFFMYLSACTAIPCAAWRILLDRYPQSLAWSKIAAFAALLTLGEWARSQFFNGFTSLSLGYSLIDTWFSGVIPIAGIYGLSFLGFCIAGWMASMVANTISRQPAILAAVVVTAATWAAGNIEWVHPIGPTLTYRLIQANVAQAEKFDPLHTKRHALHLSDLIERGAADLIVTPETAFTSFLNELPADLVPRIRRFSQRTSSSVFLGIATASANSDGYNSILQIRPDADSSTIPHYNKVHLMPFGEYSPAGFGWFTSRLQIPLKDMSAGTPDQRAFEVQKGGVTQRIGSLICHEDLTSSDARYWAGSANILLNPSNLAWFEKSLAISQRLQIVRTRALEVGRPILRVANTGVTAAIDARGSVVNQLPPDAEGILSGEIQPVTGATPYTRFGDGIVWIMCLIGIGMSAASKATVRLWNRKRP